MANKTFLKWAGNKTRLMPILRLHIGGGNRLVEPFMGSGAIFLETNFSSYYLNDVNPDLIGLYNNLKNNTDALLQELDSLFDGTHAAETEFYNLRKEFNTLQSSDIRKSALFVYLNRHAFNGLCRYNSKGEFNVPFGRYKTVYFPKEELLNFAEKSQNITFVCSDFTDVLQQVQSGDVVYCDPPYVPLSPTANFTAYAQSGFTYDQQKKLAEEAKRLTSIGATVIISNHDTAVTRELYKDAEIHELEVQRFVSGKAESRGKAKELIAIFK